MNIKNIKKKLLLFVSILLILILLFVFLKQIWKQMMIDGNDMVSPYAFELSEEELCTLSDNDILFQKKDINRFFLDCEAFLKENKLDGRLYQARIVGLSGQFYQIYVTYKVTVKYDVIRSMLLGLSRDGYVYFSNENGERKITAEFPFFLDSLDEEEKKHEANLEFINYNITNNLVNYYVSMLYQSYDKKSIYNDYIHFFARNINVYYDDRLMGTFDAPKADQ